MFGYEDELQFEIEILKEEVEKLKWVNKLLKEELAYEKRNKVIAKEV